MFQLLLPAQGCGPLRIFPVQPVLGQSSGWRRRRKVRFSALPMGLRVLAAFLALAPVSTLSAAVIITEFMADNRSSLLDEDGEPSDWIELHNPGPAPVNLSGWALTDRPGNPAPWGLPDAEIEAGGYRIVFASGKDRKGAGQEWHADFRLSASGEYLALLRPDRVTIATEFAPTYPPQEPDISYGLPALERSSPDLLTTDGPTGARVLVPTDAAALPSDWATPAAAPAGDWNAVAGWAIGFDRSPASAGGNTNLARLGAARQSSTGFGFGANLAIDGNPDTFTHTGSSDNDSSWSVDLGAVFEIRRVVLRNRSSCCGSRLRDITVRLLAADGISEVWSSAMLNPENRLGSPATLTVDLAALNLAPIPARWVQVRRAPDPDLSGSGGVGNADEDNVLSLGEVEVYGLESLSFARDIRTDLSSAMLGKVASAFVRAPFVLPALPTIQGLTLRLRYDDGLIVYLNGTRVGSWHAPTVSTWNATALTERAKADALVPVALDLGPFRSLWREGSNWLAFQVLNAAAADPDLLLDAQLLADTGAARSMAYLDRPTPRAANNVTGNRGRVADTKFSASRGFYSAPFDLAITTATPGAEIRYTLDGSRPEASHGTVYTGPVRIDRTRVVRAAAFLTDYRPTDSDTRTYVFVEDVVRQPARPDGFPATWAEVAADYGMDARITENPAYRGRVPEALQSLPTVALTTENDHWFGASRGIYANPERNGADWERPVSMEWIAPDGRRAFQIDCGVRVQGGYFRNRNVTQKHSLRLLFKAEYGPGKLQEDLFQEFGAVREFDTLVLRAGANDGYAWGEAKDTEQFIRDEFGRRTLLAMGQPSPRGLFVHLYLNGLYWGLYNLTERPAEDFSAAYLGGAPEDWDAINSGEVKQGSLDAWRQLLTGIAAVTTLADYQKLKGLNADGSAHPSLPPLFDAPNYIDYMLVNIWGGNWDWPNKNFWFGRERSGRAGGFKFYAWDFENTMGNNRGRSPLNMVSPRSGVADSWVGEPHARLSRFSEYQIEFADRVQRHCFGGGVLTPASLVARYRDLAEQVTEAIIPESARWGDDNLSPPQDQSDWIRERDWILQTYLAQRTDIVLGQLRSRGLFPRTEAPAFDPAPGAHPVGSVLRLLTRAPELYYTTNGVDPRLPGGAVHPAAVKLTTGGTVSTEIPRFIRPDQTWRYLDAGMDPGPAWLELEFNDASWKSGPAPLGYGDGDEATVVGFVDADPATAGVQKNATTYFRTAFNVMDPGAFRSLTALLVYDDAAAVYLNGQEVWRASTLPAGARFNTYATAASADNAVEAIDALPATRLRAGRNVVAVEVHQSDGASSDISFSLELNGVPANEGAVASAHTLVLTESTRIKARARTGSEWSALQDGLFVLGTTPASSNNLVVSEVLYRPAEPLTPAERAVSTDRDDFEFVELLNVGSETIDLGGVRFVQGVRFTFPTGRTLVPGERTLVVGRREAVIARYGAQIRIEGEFEGRLDNSGETIVVVDAAGRALLQWTYLDGSPWPSLSHEGYGLVLMRPETKPDLRDPHQWRAGVRLGGSPGTSDATRFHGAASADADGNGQWDLLDYALGANVSGLAGPGAIAVAVQALEIDGVMAEYLVLSLPRNPAADDAPLQVETAPSLGGPWRQDGVWVPLREERSEGGAAQLVLRLAEPVRGGSAFVRLSVRHEPRP